MGTDLTKREYFAAHILPHFIKARYEDPTRFRMAADRHGQSVEEYLTGRAVGFADALIKALNEKENG